MYLKQADLFWGMSQDAIQKITGKAVKREFQKDDVIFKASDQADHFYVLIQGKVRMELAKSSRCVYSSDTTGEIFGWSTLTGREDYSATVICEEQTKALQFHKVHVMSLLEEDSDCAANFYKQLAGALGSRLLETYDLLE
ncbi:MAG: Crp/Fnr family transcriptional regulator [Desulfopila sp.]